MTSRAKSRHSQLEAITIPVESPMRKQIQLWEKRAGELAFTRRDALRFADWIDPLREAWLTEAKALGWEPSERFAHIPSGCSDLAGLFAHVNAVDGQTIHLLLETRNRSMVVLGRRCFQGTPDTAFEHLWADQDRLTHEEISSGAPCKGCVRGFFGGPPSIPTLDRTPEQQADTDTEDAAYRRLHGECQAARWSLSGGGVAHCSRCCAPPPLPPGALTKVAQILRGAQERDERLAAQWNAAIPRKPKPSQPTASQAAVKRLEREAQALGYRLVPEADTDRPADAVHCTPPPAAGAP